MSEHSTPNDPVDKAYVEAEAMLNETGEARAARRARILAAVAGATEDARQTPGPARGRAVWRHGGWLAAASVAGVSLLLANQVRPPIGSESPGVEQAAPQAAAPAPADWSVTPPAAPAIAQMETRAAASSGAASPVSPPAAVAPAPAPAPAPQADQAAPEARARMSAPLPRSEAEELVVSGSRVERSARAAKAEDSSADRAEQLRDAAAAGQLRDLTALLARGAPVDAIDERGETALMKSVQANHPRAAALLRRNGANLDLRNDGGLSVRDMAASADDPDLDEALGLSR